MCHGFSLTKCDDDFESFSTTFEAAWALVKVSLSLRPITINKLSMSKSLTHFVDQTYTTEE